MVDFGSMKRPQGNLNTHIIRDSPKTVAVGGVLLLFCKSHGGTEGLAGTRSCSSLFQFPGLAPISYAHKRSSEEGQFPDASLPLAGRVGNTPLGERSPFAIRSASQSNGTACFLWAGGYLAARIHVCNVHRWGVLQKTSGQSVLTDLMFRGLLAITTAARFCTSPTT